MKELRNTLVLIFAVALVFAGVYRFIKPGNPEGMPLQRPMDALELPDGSILTADGGGYYWNDSGSKLLRIGRNKKVLWAYRGNLSFVHDGASMKNGHFLIADSGNNRLIETDRFKNHIWISDSMANYKGKLRDGSHLNYPVSVLQVKNGHFLVTDNGNGRILEMDKNGRIYFTAGGLDRPASARMTPEGNYLATETGKNRVVILDRNGKQLWQFAGLSAPMDAFPLSNGNILIADTGNDRIVTAGMDGKVLRVIKGPLNRPNRAIELQNGNILVCDTGHARLVEFDRENSVVWDFRNINQVRLREELTNGSAEIVASKKPAGWITCDLYTRHDGLWTVDSNVTHSGKNSLSIKTDRLAAGRLFWGQVVKARPGSKAELSSFLKNDLTEGVSGIGVLFLDEMNGTIGSTNLAEKNLTNGWKELKLSFRLPNGTDALFVQLYTEGKGTVHFDEVVLSMDKK